MMKKLTAILFALIMCMLVSASAYAEADLPRFVDTADLLDTSAEVELTAKLNEISLRQQFDVVIVTVLTTDGKSPMEYADDFYDYNGYGFGDSYDGVLLLVAVEDRECWMSTSGYGITAFTDGDIDYILDEFAEEYQRENYAEAFNIFAEYCDEYVTIARDSEKFDPAFTGVVALIIGFIVALIATSVMKGQLKSVRFKAAASDYTKHGSLSVTESRDFFLYRTVSRREKPKENSVSSTHTSSSGRMHGGVGRSL